METLLLSKKDVEALVAIPDAVRIVEEVYAGHADGTIVMPPKLSLDLGESGRWPHFDSYVNSMPAYIGKDNVAGVKIIGGFFANVGTKIPSIMGLIVLIDPVTGVPLAIMDGTYITALRTGASVAVGAKYLAKKGANTLSLIGAGTQSRFSLRALAALFRFESVVVSDVRAEAAAKFAEEMSGELALSVKATDDPSKLFGADIVVSATTSKTPVIDGNRIARGSLIEPLGSYQEIDAETAKRANRVVVDSMDQAKHRGSFASLIEHGVVGPEILYAEISEIVSGRKKGRESQDDIIVFEPIGMGSTDIATASFAYRRAAKEAMGEGFEFL
ncbi:MAG: ornithine cyclodeaminase family protein [Thaumarchaeota archaeon]|nr:ornithine cyclodeaminase family protein [Nitrososphaerota archaeon]